VWVQQDSWNTATDVYQEPAQWQNLNLQMLSGGGGTYIAQTTGYLIDPATGGGIGGQTINLYYTETFADGTGNSGPTDQAITNSQGYFINQQGMGPPLVQVTVTIWWNNPPSYYYNPGSVTLSISGYWG
jgi:hypothetical protein